MFVLRPDDGKLYVHIVSFDYFFFLIMNSNSQFVMKQLSKV